MDDFGDFDFDLFMKEIDQLQLEDPQCRFKFVEELTIQEMCKKKYSANSMRRISSDFKCFNEWRQSRNSARQVQVPTKPLEEFDDDELNQWLPAFLAEVRKIDGTEYKARVIFEKTVIFQMFLHLHGRPVHFFNEPKFEPIKNAVDKIMKDLQQIGLGYA